MAARYAIYFVPAAESVLYRFGAALLGYDSYSGRDCPLIDGVDASWWPGIVAEPRLYGFHATLKAPFRLVEGVAENDLVEDARSFARAQPVLSSSALALHAIGSFLALVPSEPNAAIGQLADACVERFDRFRAPMTSDERSRRLRSPLTLRQIEHLDRWGYPHVFEEFRFHMTLTGSLPPSERDTVRKILNTLIEQHSEAQTLCIDRIALAKQDDARARFRVLDTFMLR